MFRGLGKLEYFGQRRVFGSRIDPHFGRQGFLHFAALQPAYQFGRQFGLFCAFQNGRAFNLAECAAFEEKVAGGRGAVFAFGVVDFGRRAGGIADHEGIGAAVLGKVGVVGFAPAFGDFHAVLAHLRPPFERAFFTHAADVGQEEGEAGRGCGGRRGHQKVFIFRFGQVLQGLRQGQFFLFKPFFVVVDGDIGVIDGQRIGQGSGYGRGFGLVGGEDACGFGFADVGVVQTVNRIGNRVGLAQNQLVEHFVAAACLDDGHFGIVGFFKLRDDGLGQAEGFVHGQTYFGLGVQVCRSQ